MRDSFMGVLVAQANNMIKRTIFQIHFELTLFSCFLFLSKKKNYMNFC